MPDKKLTDNEIVKALECCLKNLACIHEKYEPACGIWCEHLHKWCIDFNGKSLKENCSEYKPCCSMPIEKQALDLINRLQAENEQWQGGYMTQKQEIANLEIELKAMRGAANSYKAENERLKDHIQEGVDLAKQLPEMITLTKAEAYKEMADKLTMVFINLFRLNTWQREELKDAVDRILKEKCGVDNEG